MPEHGNESAVVSYTSVSFFRTLGVAVQRGRFFTAEDEQFDAPSRVVVISDSYWNAAWKRRPDALGARIEIDSATYVVIGVAPRRFQGLDLDRVDLWLPLPDRPLGNEGPWWESPGWNVVRLIVRPNSGVGASEVRRQLNRLYAEVNRNESWYLPQERIGLAPVLRANGPFDRTAAEQRGLTFVVRLGAVAFLVILIAVSNGIGLLLYKALSSRRDVAIRLSLGMSHRRYVAEQSVEGVILAIASLVVAVGISEGGSTTLRNLLFRNIQWGPSGVRSGTVLALAVTSATAIVVVYYLPIAIALRIVPDEALQSAGTGRRIGIDRIRGTLIGVQAGLCLILLLCAGLVLQSLRRGRTLDFGFAPNGLLMADLNGQGLRPATLFDLGNAISNTPGVRLVGRANSELQGGTRSPVTVAGGFQGREWPLRTLVDSAYPRAVGLRLLAGRLPSPVEERGPVALVNSTMAREYWGAATPIGSCFGTSSDGCVRVVGVVGDVRWDIGSPPTPRYYLFADHFPAAMLNVYFMRTAATDSPERIATKDQVRTVLRKHQLPNIRLAVAAEDLAPQFRPWVVSAGLLTSYGILAVVCATLGIWGLVASEGATRRREFAIRAALGATRIQLMGHLLLPVLVSVALGLAAGIALGIPAAIQLKPLLVNTAPNDTMILTNAACTILVVSAIGAIGGARRATRQSLMDDLRSE